MKLKSTAQRLRSRALFTIVGGVVVINPAFAQQPVTSPVASQTRSEPLEEVVVTGLRASLEASMDIKRDAVGVVDVVVVVGAVDNHAGSPCRYQVPRAWFALPVAAAGCRAQEKTS